MTPRMVLDCSALLPGPFVGKLLVQRGCRVLKVESPERPDPARAMSSYYADLNEAKEHVSLSLMGNGPDRARFEELVRQADGLIEGFRPAAKKKLGLDEATLLAINPRLCIASLTGYPESGPWGDRAGHDLNFEAVTGCLSLFGQMPALPLADLFASYEAALSLLAAMDQVSRSVASGMEARGRRIEISMSEALKNAQSKLVRKFKDDGIVPRYEQTLFSGMYPCYREYRAGCGKRVAVGALEPKFWQKTCGILGLAHLASEGWHESGPRREAVIAEVQAAFGRRPWVEWAPLFDAADCCVEPVLDFGEVYGVKS